MCSQCSRGPVTTRKASPIVSAGHATNMLMTRMRRVTLRRSSANSSNPPGSAEFAMSEVEAERADVGDVDDGVHEDPDEVDEVPVHAGRLRQGVAVLVELALAGAQPDDEEDAQAAEDVQAVRPGQHEERRHELARPQRVALADEVAVLPHLAGQEDQAEQDGQAPPLDEGGVRAGLDGVLGLVDGPRRAEQSSE